MQSYFDYLRLNINTFATLLQTWCAELRSAAGESATSTSVEEALMLTASLTTAARHALAPLRLYSAWLLTNSHVLASGLGDETIKALVPRFWATYAECLSLVARAFPVKLLPEVPYQLEEDVESTGFMPLESERTQKLWLDALGGQKPRHDQTTRLVPNMEMLARVRDLLVDGLLLAVDQVCFA